MGEGNFTEGEYKTGHNYNKKFLSVFRILQKQIYTLGSLQTLEINQLYMITESYSLIPR